MSGVTPIIEKNPEIDFHKQGSFAVKVGPTNIQPTKVTTTAYPSGLVGVTTFTAQPPNPATAMSRQVWINFDIELDINQAAGNLNPGGATMFNYGNFDSLAAYPLSRMIQSMNVQINDQQLTFVTYRAMQALLRCNYTQEELQTYNSGTPTFLDQTSALSAYIVQNLATSVANVNAFQGHSCNSQGTAGLTSMFRKPRGSFKLTYIEQVSKDRTRIGFHVREPLFISPFNLGVKEDYCMIGVNQFQLSLQLAEPQRMLSHQDETTISAFAGVGSTGNGPTVTNPWTVTAYTPSNPNGAPAIGGSDPYLEITWLSIPSFVPIPKRILYPYHRLDTYFNNVSQNFNLAAGANRTGLTGQNLQLNSYPSRIIVSCPRVTQSELYPLYSDQFLRIDRVSITWDNQTGILANATAHQLWQMSARNGYQGTWDDWNDGFGSVLILDIGSNFPIPKEGDAPGLPVNKQLQITLDVTNVTNPTVSTNMTVVNGLNNTWTVDVFIVYAGIMSIVDLHTELSASPLTAQAISSAHALPATAPMLMPRSFYGSAFGDKWKQVKAAAANKGISQGLSKAAAVADVLGYSKIGAFGRDAANRASLAGLGFRGGQLLDKSELGKRIAEERDDTYYNDDYEDYESDY